MWKLKVAEGGKMLMSGNNHIGRQHWEFDPDAGTLEERAEVERLRRHFELHRFVNKQSSDALMRMQMRREKEARRQIPEAVKVEALEDVTEEAVLGLYVTKGLNTVLPYEHRKEIIRYIYNHQNEDGGWGLHIEGNSTMFSTTLTYVALRLLGERIDEDQNDAVSRGRKWILDRGGAVGIPSWGKFWLAVIGIYDWDGCNPVPPEFWLVPNISPIHPGKMLCYCRLVYMPMSYLYGKRFVGEITTLIQQLRQEVYVEPYHQTNWNLARKTIAKEDVYYPHPLVQDMLWDFLYHVEEPMMKLWPFSKLREKALKVAMEHIHYEDINSRYLTIGCVEKILCLVACWVEDPNSEAYQFHLARIPDYFWVAEDGMKMQGCGSQMWDASLAIQAIISSDLIQEYGETLRKAHDFLKASQIREDPSGNFEQMYRHTTKGSWTFSLQDHGWQVSDCTAEGLKVALLCSQMPEELVGESMEIERLHDSINVILTLQSKNGGFPAWEPQRAYRWLELHPRHRREEIETCIKSGLQYILDEQNPDGSWKGSWGIGFTYGIWFAVDALTSCGMNYDNCVALRKACEFLLSKQLSDGGWGESYLSCKNKVYTNIEGNRSNLVQTSWALLALIKAGQVAINPTSVEKGVRLLINSQVEKDGDYPQQEMTGIFYKTCSLQYGAYRNIFPIWALGEYRRCLMRR
ncbi:hypothetical protein V2J09_005712 [Rumex salicifolius]